MSKSTTKPDALALRPREAAFVASYMSGQNAKAAAIAAGYSPKHAVSRAHVLITSNPRVVAALAAARDVLQAKTDYNAEAASAYLDRVIDLAEKSKQLNAAVKAAELKMKLHGLLVEKLAITVEKIDIKQSLADAKSRALRPRCDLDEPIEGEFKALPGVAATRTPDELSVEPVAHPYISPMDILL